MAKSIHERARAAIAAREKARKAAEYKAGEAQRRSDAAKFAAQVRKDNRIDAVIEGRAEPRTSAEQVMLDRMDFGVDDIDDRSDGQKAEDDEMDFLGSQEF